MTTGGFSRPNVVVAISLFLCVVCGERVVAEWDYIVIGAGTSGCALSSQLSTNASKRVLVLEAGGPMTWDFGGREQRDYFRNSGGNSNVTVFDVPAEALPTLLGGMADFPEFWWGTVPWALQGRGVGGSGAANAAMSFSASPEDFAEWPQGWSYDDMKSFYEEVLEVTGIGYRTSADGKLYLHEAGDALNRVLKNQLGFTNESLNENPVRVNTSSFTEHYSKGGQRFDSCLAFLLPALNTNENIELRINSPVKRIVFSKHGLAAGVELENGEGINLNEGGKVVVAAGPLNSAKVLMYSGIGPVSELERLDKNALVRNPRELWITNEEVGASMHDHQYISFTVKAPNDSANIQYQINFSDSQGVADYFNHRSGPLAQFLVPRLGFLSMPGRSAPDFEIGAFNYFFNPVAACSTCIELFMISLKPSARDALKINTPDLNCSCMGQACKVEDFCVPDIYYSNEKDLDEGVWALDTFIKAFESEGYTVTSLTSKDPASLRTWLANQPFVPSAFHFAGTCALGRCTDKDLKVKGTENIYVGDSSVFPAPVRTHNAMTTMAVGRKAASHISKSGD